MSTRNNGKAWWKIGKWVFNIEDIIALYLDPAATTLDIYLTGGNVISLTDMDEILEFKAIFKEHARERGDHINGV